MGKENRNFVIALRKLSLLGMQLARKKWTQKRSFLKKKPTWLVLSVFEAGFWYLQKARYKYIKYGGDHLLVLEKLSDFLFHLLPGFFVCQFVITDDVLEVDISSD